jgi:hypothetical protein
MPIHFFPFPVSDIVAHTQEQRSQRMMSALSKDLRML